MKWQNVVWKNECFIEPKTQKTCVHLQVNGQPNEPDFPLKPLGYLQLSNYEHVDFL